MLKVADGGPSLLASYGPSKSQWGWKDAMSQAQEPNTDRSHHGPPVLRPRLKVQKLSDFILSVC